MSENDVIQARLDDLLARHRELDAKIATGSVNMIEIQRLKREKLALKDAIARLQAELCDDIIA